MEKTLVKTRSSGYFEREHPVVEIVGAHYESQEMSVGWMDINVKISNFRIENRKPHGPFLRIG